MTQRRVRWASAVALGVLLVVAAADPAGAAPPAAPDTVVSTRDGAVYQGVLVEQIPGDHVTIQTADGKIHTFADSQVEAVRPLGARHPVEPLAPRAGGSAGVLVDLATTHPNARLVQLSVSGSGVAAPNPEICGPPCGVRVSPGTYVVGGDGIVPSPAFSLREVPGHVRVTADPVTMDRRAMSLILAVGGGIGVATVGLPIWLAGAVLESSENSSEAMGLQPPTHVGGTIKWTGIVITAVCLAAGIAGLATYPGTTSARVDPVGP